MMIEALPPVVVEILTQLPVVALFSWVIIRVIQMYMNFQEKEREIRTTELNSSENRFDRAIEALTLELKAMREEIHLLQVTLMQTQESNHPSREVPSRPRSKSTSSND
jgi:hypothetical protein